MQKKEYPYQNRVLKDLKSEQWGDIPELDGAYRISNFGRVRALRRWAEREYRGGFWVREKILAQHIQAQKVCDAKRTIYRLVVPISYNRKKYSIAVARMVYFLFVRKFDLEDRTLIVSYKDGNAFNICPQNLVLTNPSASITKAYKNNHRNLIMFGNVALVISQYDLTGKKLNTYESVNSASNVTGAGSSAISTALKRKDGYGSGYIWRKGDGKQQLHTIPITVKKMMEAERLRSSIITQYDLTGKKIKEYNNLSEAAKAVKAQPNYIRLILLGKAFTCANSFWKLGEGPATIDVNPILEQRLEKLRKRVCRSVIQFDLKGKKIKSYRSIAEAARTINVKPVNIHGVLKIDKPYTCKGFLWQYRK